MRLCVSWHQDPLPILLWECNPQHSATAVNRHCIVCHPLWLSESERPSVPHVPRLLLRYKSGRELGPAPWTPAELSTKLWLSPWLRPSTVWGSRGQMHSRFPLTPSCCCPPQGQLALQNKAPRLSVHSSALINCYCWIELVPPCVCAYSHTNTHTFWSSNLQLGDAGVAGDAFAAAGRAVSSLLLYFCSLNSIFLQDTEKVCQRLWGWRWGRGWLSPCQS